MKFRMLLSALLLAAGILCVAGCGKKVEAKAEAKDAEKLNSPTAVMKKLCAALNKMDFAAAAKLCDGKAKNDIEGMAKEVEQLKAAAAKGDEKSKKMFAQIKDGFAKMKIEVKSEKIEGEFAILESVMTRFDGETREEKIYLKKIGGDWKLIDDKDYKPAKK